MTDPYSDDADRAERLGHRFLRKLTSFRTRIQQRPVLGFFYRAVIAFVGSVLILAGMIMLVTPGPGWLTIFLGLAVMGTEFAWARRFLGWLRMQLTRLWEHWKIVKRARRAKNAERKATRRAQQQARQRAKGRSRAADPQAPSQ